MMSAKKSTSSILYVVYVYLLVIGPFPSSWLKNSFNHCLNFWNLLSRARTTLSSLSKEKCEPYANIQKLFVYPVSIYWVVHTVWTHHEKCSRQCRGFWCSQIHYFWALEMYPTLPQKGPLCIRSSDLEPGERLGQPKWSEGLELWGHSPHSKAARPEEHPGPAIAENSSPPTIPTFPQLGKKTFLTLHFISPPLMP